MCLTEQAVHGSRESVRQTRARRFTVSNEVLSETNQSTKEKDLYTANPKTASYISFMLVVNKQ